MMNKTIKQRKKRFPQLYAVGTLMTIIKDKNHSTLFFQLEKKPNVKSSKQEGGRPKIFTTTELFEVKVGNGLLKKYKAKNIQFKKGDFIYIRGEIHPKVIHPDDPLKRKLFNQIFITTLRTIKPQSTETNGTTITKETA